MLVLSLREHALVMVARGYDKRVAVTCLRLDHDVSAKEASKAFTSALADIRSMPAPVKA